MRQGKQFAARFSNGELVGPLVAQQVCDLIRQGRLRAEDRLAIVGETFRPVSAYPEFLPLLRNIGGLGENLVANTPSVVPDIFVGLEGTTQDVKVYAPGLEAPTSPSMTPPEMPSVVGGDSSSEEELFSVKYSGALSETPFVHLFYYFHVRKMTGRLSLQQTNKEVRDIWFEQGIPRRIRLTPEIQDLGRRLLTQGLCTPTQLQDAMKAANTNAIALGDQLLMMGVLNPYLLFEVLQKQFQERLMSCASWCEGLFFFFGEEVTEEPEIPFSLDCLDLIKQGIYEYYDLSRLQLILEPWYNHPVTKSSNPLVNIEHLRLSPQEARIFNGIHRSQTLWELMEEVTRKKIASRVDVHRFLFFLGQVELVLFRQQSLGSRLQDQVRMLGGR